MALFDIYLSHVFHPLRKGKIELKIYRTVTDHKTKKICVTEFFLYNIVHSVKVQLVPIKMNLNVHH